MARTRRVESPTGVYHWITRGVNKKHLFHSFQDYSFFKKLLLEYKISYEIQIFHYCFMPNHIHLLLLSPNLEALGKFSHFVLRRYTYYYCKSHGWTGSVFQKGYKSLVVEKESYLLECGRYIERNPLKASLTTTLSEYPYSSYGFYTANRGDDLVTPSPAYLALSDNPNDQIATYVEYVSQTRAVDEMAGKGLLSV